MKISDSHTDFLTSIERCEDRNKYIKNIKNFGVTTLSCAVFTTNKNFSIKDIKDYSNELNNLSQKYNINLLLSIEDMSFIKSEEELAELIDLKPISVTLTWNEANQFAGGANTNLGLTNLGRKYIKILENNNILVDTAHLSRKAFWEFYGITKFPIYNSHSNIYSLKHHQRNLTNKQIDAIVKTNGYMGLTLYNKFISNGKIISEDVAYQFDYLIKKYGCKNFGLGTDLYGIDIDNLPEDIKGYSEINNLFYYLGKYGYKNKIINYIAYKNFNKFINKILIDIK